MLAASSVQRPPCSGSKETPGRLSAIPNTQHVRSTSWHSQGRSLFPVFVLALALVTFPASVSAAPPRFTPGVYAVINGVYQRRQNPSPPADTTSNSQSSGGNSSSGSISMNIWVRRMVVSSLMCIVSVTWTLCSCFAVDSFFGCDSFRLLSSPWCLCSSRSLRASVAVPPTMHPPRRLRTVLLPTRRGSVGDPVERRVRYQPNRCRRI